MTWKGALSCPIRKKIESWLPPESWVAKEASEDVMRMGSSARDAFEIDFIHPYACVRYKKKRNRRSKYDYKAFFDGDICSRVIS